MPIAMPIQASWLKSVLIDRGYLARIKGDAIKIYLAMLESCGGEPGRSVTVSLSQLMKRTNLTSPTIVDGLSRLETLGLVVASSQGPGKVKSYYVSDPPEQMTA